MPKSLAVYLTLASATAHMALPNPQLTPGAVRTTSAAVACQRPLPPRPHEATWYMLKTMALREWGIPESRRGEYELDHLIPRGLGGADTLDNLWVEPWPEAQIKDEMERRKIREVCDNPSDEALRAAQEWFRTDQWAK